MSHYVRKTQHRRARTQNGDALRARLRRHVSHCCLIGDVPPQRTSPIMNQKKIQNGVVMMFMASSLGARHFDPSASRSTALCKNSLKKKEGEGSRRIQHKKTGWIGLT
jgi:hypothetical protein